MKSIYNDNETCLDFTNEEIIQYLVKPLEEHDNLEIKVKYNEFSNDALYEVLELLNIKSNLPEILAHNDSMRQEIKKEKKITHINLDGEKNDFSITLYDHMVAIFILNQEFMFIDDEARKNHTSSDTFGNVAYEGELRKLPHKAILELIYQFIVLLKESKKITIKETEEKDRGFQYPKCSYEIELKKDAVEPKMVEIENIAFLIKNV